MHRFKNNVSDGWLFRQELRFFENLARNWDRDVEDCDFFDLFGDGNNSDVSEATAMLKKFFPVETLAKLDGINVERSSPDEDPDEEAPIARHRRHVRHGDADGDQCRTSPVSSFLEGGSSGMLEGQFYRKVPVDDALPWVYYGRLVEEHGDILKDLIRSARGRRGANILLYREAADAGFFWAQLNLGWYFLANGGEANTKDGLALLEKALANIPDEPEPGESPEENAEFKKELASVIEQAFFAKTGRVSSRVTDLEERSGNGDLLADIDLALAYLAGADCPRNRDKALAHASRTLFHDREFDVLLDRMNDLSADDRDWLMRNLHAEANKA